MNKDKLKELHIKEDELNKEMAKIDAKILALKKQKLKIAKRISHNMKYRNKLINQLWK